MPRELLYFKCVSVLLLHVRKRVGVKVAARGVLTKADELKLDKILSFTCGVSHFCYILLSPLLSDLLGAGV